MKDELYQKLLLAKELSKKKKYDEALVLYEELHKEISDDAYIIFNLAKILTRINSEKRNVKLAREYFLSILETDKREMAILELGRLESNQKNYDEAVEYFKLLLNTRYDKQAKFELGKVYSILENLELARNYFLELVINYNDNYSKLELARVYIKLNEFSEAKYYLFQMFGTKDENLAIFELGNLELMQGNIKKAKGYYKRLLDTKSANYARMQLGKIEASCGNLEEANNYYMDLYNYSNLKRDKAYALFESGRLKASLGEYDEACELFLTSIRDYDDNYSKLELGKVYEARGEFEKAYDCYYGLLGTNNDRYAKISISKLLCKLGRYEEAKSYYNSLLEKGVSDPDYVYALLELLNLDLAFEKYEDALGKVLELLKLNKLNLDRMKQYEFYIKYKLGLKVSKSMADSYFGRQVIDYNRDFAIECIKSFTDVGSKNSEIVYYNENVSIEELYDFAVSHLNDTVRETMGLTDKYIIDTGTVIGSCYGKEATALEVIAINNTKNIITMYPVIGSYKVDIVTRVKKRTKNGKYNI